LQISEMAQQRPGVLMAGARHDFFVGVHVVFLWIWDVSRVDLLPAWLIV
jgi:hypothetical protein